MNGSYLITGGASGLGAACARRIVARGGRVVLADVDTDAGPRRATELGEAALFAETDVTREASVAAALDLACDRLGPLAGVVQCAGIIGAARIVGRQGPHSLEAFRQVVEVNLIGTFNVLRLAACRLQTNPPDEEGQRGVIVNTASIAAFEGQIGQAAYAASKGGVAALTLPAARELAQHGIRVVAVAPGVFETPMMANLPEAVRQSLAEQSPFPRRLGRPDEFASLVEQVLDNRMLNGCVLRLDAALRMSG